MKKCMKCKDCKYFQREKISESRSGICYHEKWKDGSWGGHSYLIGCGRKACEDFQK